MRMYRQIGSSKTSNLGFLGVGLAQGTKDPDNELANWINDQQNSIVGTKGNLLTFARIKQSVVAYRPTHYFYVMYITDASSTKWIRIFAIKKAATLTQSGIGSPNGLILTTSDGSDIIIVGESSDAITASPYNQNFISWRSATNDGNNRLVSNSSNIYLPQTAPNTAPLVPTSTVIKDGLAPSGNNSADGQQIEQSRRIVLDMGVGSALTVYGIQFAGYQFKLVPSFQLTMNIRFYDNAGTAIILKSYTAAETLQAITDTGSYFALDAPVANVRFIGIASNADGNNILILKEMQYFSGNTPIDRTGCILYSKSNIIFP